MVQTATDHAIYRHEGEVGAAVSDAHLSALHPGTATVESDDTLAPGSEGTIAAPSGKAERRPGRRIAVVLRYDDCSAISRTDVEQQIIASLRRNRLCCTFAVVPAIVAGQQHDRRPQQVVPLPSEKAALLEGATRDGTVEVAMHGYCHQTRRAKGLRGYSEFAGADAPEQGAKIRAGAELLGRTFPSPVRVFVPPWNTYDTQTLQLLQQAGFTALSADPGGPLDSSGQIKSVPTACTLSQLRRAIECARASADSAPVVGVLFHQFDFREVEPGGGWDLDEFGELMRWLAEQPDVQVRTVGHVAGSDRLPKVWQLRVMRWLWRVRDFIPYGGPLPWVIWSSPRMLCCCLLTVGMYAVLFYALVGLAAAGLGWAVRSLQHEPDVAAMYRLLGWGGVGVSLLMAAALLRNADRRIKLCVAVGLALGICTAALW